MGIFGYNFTDRSRSTPAADSTAVFCTARSLHLTGHPQSTLGPHTDVHTPYYSTKQYQLITVQNRWVAIRATAVEKMGVARAAGVRVVRVV